MEKTAKESDQLSLALISRPPSYAVEETQHPVLSFARLTAKYRHPHAGHEDDPDPRLVLPVDRRIAVRVVVPDEGTRDGERYDGDDGLQCGIREMVRSVWQCPFGRSAGRTMSRRDDYGTLTERTSHGVWRTLRDRSEGMMGDS